MYIYIHVYTYTLIYTSTSKIPKFDSMNPTKLKCTTALLAKESWREHRQLMFTLDSFRQCKDTRTHYHTCTYAHVHIRTALQLWCEIVVKSGAKSTEFGVE